MPIALIYHDVVPDGAFDSSGFPGASAAHYKFSEAEFHRHLAALASLPTLLASATHHRAPTGSGGAPTNIANVSRSAFSAAGTLTEKLMDPVDFDGSAPCLLTFDDGGCSAYATVAGLLEARGWRGHFFITTDFLDQPGFLTSSEMRELHQRGHVIGSHSCSHPARMSACTRTQLVDEWRRSCDVLAAITGEPVTTASVPGGFFSRRVAEAAAAAGIRTLFTSEPTAGTYLIDGCTVQGRYSVDRSVSIETVAAIAAGKIFPRLRQSALWQIKKAAKTIAGPLYAEFRNRVLRRSLSSPAPTGHDHNSQWEVPS
ncbi:MAG: polysaccharide deacetylase family protein [Planctomycetia bacterium]|nr:polysaccharide deacetylase family protein [Planctomycetia bacterium]